MIIKVKSFRAKNLKPNRVVLMIGRKGSGKSTALRELLFSLKDQIEYAVAMTPTFETIKDLQAVMPIKCIHTEYNEDVVNAIVEHQQERNLNDQEKKIVAIILDDCMYDKKTLSSEAINKLHMNGRHLNILFINLVQYVMDYPARLRNSVDYIFAWWETQRDIRFKLWKTFFGIFDKYDDFDCTMRGLTVNKRCMVIDNTLSATSASECIFHFKASQFVPAFMLGSRQFWKQHYQSLQDELQRREKKNEQKRKRAEEEGTIQAQKQSIQAVAKRPRISASASASASSNHATAHVPITQVVIEDEDD